MNYYPLHIGDFRSGTVNMSRISRWIYRDMMDVYYDTEAPLPLDIDVLCDALGVEASEERAIVERLLRFKFVETDAGYRHEVCEQVIADYHTKAETAKANGKLGGRPRKAGITQQEPSGFQSGSYLDATGGLDKTQSQTNQEPITNNHKPNKTKAEAATPSALPDWMPLDSWAGYLDMRKKQKKVPTARAIELVIMALEKMRAEGQNVAAVLDKSTANGWTDVYAIKPDARGAAPANQKFNFDQVDRSGDRAAQAATVARHNIVVPEGEIEL